MTTAHAVASRAMAMYEPPPDLTVSQSADAGRIIAPGTSTHPGLWQTDREPPQRGVMDSVHEGAYMVVERKSARVGAALALDTPIPTISGWKMMEHLKSGDEVFDELGQRCVVTFVSEIMAGRECYRVEFSDGSEIVADADHRWSVESDLAIARGFPGLRFPRRGRVPRNIQIEMAGTLTTQEIRDTLFLRPGRARYAIPLAGPLECETAELSVDPYVLGVWLGDGNSRSSQITQHESDAEELMDHLRGCGVAPEVRANRAGTLTISLEPRRQRGNVCIRGHDPAKQWLTAHGKPAKTLTRKGYCGECARQYSKAHQFGSPMDPISNRRDSIAGRLTALGLLMVPYGEGRQNRKHIPTAYLRASAAQRLALLHGLMDTDGTCGTNGRCEFSTSLPALRDGVCELLVSLGLKFGVVESGPHSTRGRDGYSDRVYVSSSGWRVQFIAYRDLPVFRLRRKLSRQPERIGRKPSQVERRRIVAIEPTTSVPVRCIAVDSPSHLYLAGRAMIPTHNTEILLNIIRHFAKFDPKAMMLIEPSEGLGKRISKRRIAPMIAMEPDLLAKMQGIRGGRSSSSTLLYKKFSGGDLMIVGANSATQIAEAMISVLLADEINKYKEALGDEGSPLSLAIKRTATVWDAVRFLTSTPTEVGNSKIDDWFGLSDQRQFFAPCPRCGHLDYFTWNNERHFWVKFTDRDPSTAHVVCPECKGRIEDYERPQMIAEGARLHGDGPRPLGIADDALDGWHHGWHATAAFTDTIGFHVWEILASWGSIPTMVANFLKSIRLGQAALHEFWNQTLGLPFEAKGTKVEASSLIGRREPYPNAREGYVGDLPEKICALVSGTDTQDEWLEMHVWGFAPGEEGWLVDVLQIPGDPSRPEVWHELTRLYGLQYRHANGLMLPILAMGIDSGGHKTQEVYSYCAQPASIARRVYAIKGDDAPDKPLIYMAKRRWGRDEREVDLYFVGAGSSHAILNPRLLQTAAGPGYVHLPIGHHRVNEEYCAQLAGIKRVLKVAKGKPAAYVYESTRPRVEANACARYALAALRLVDPSGQQLERAWPEAIRQAAARHQEPSPAAPSTTPNGQPSPAAVAKPAPTPQRRIQRSSYLNQFS